MKQMLTWSGMILLMVLLPACDRYVRWPRDVFYQGEHHDNVSGVVRAYTKSIRMYDQFSTVALFDILWVSDEIREQFVQSRSCRKHFTAHQEEAVRACLVGQREQYITFYVFAPRAYDSYMSLACPQSSWSIALSIDGCMYQPYDICVWDLESELYDVISAHCLRARTCYRVRFAAYTRDGYHLLGPERKKDIQVIVSNATHQACAQWAFTVCGAIKVPVLKRRATLAYDL
jgi:hypothetical protein